MTQVPSAAVSTRRTFIGTIGVASLVIAGCVVGVDPDDDGPLGEVAVSVGAGADDVGSTVEDTANDVMRADAVDDSHPSSDVVVDGSTDREADVTADAIGTSRAALEIGTGVSADLAEPWGGYTPIPDDRRLRITEGIQGGFHLWGGFSAVGVPTSEVRSEWTLRTVDGVIGGGAFQTGGVSRAGRFEVAGVTVFIAQGIEVESLDEQPVALCARVQTELGSWLERCEDALMTCCDYL